MHIIFLNKHLKISLQIEHGSLLFHCFFHTVFQDDLELTM